MQLHPDKVSAMQKLLNKQPSAPAPDPHNGLISSLAAFAAAERERGIAQGQR